VKELSEFLPWVLPSVAACSDLFAEQAIRSAAIEFCERTRLWREIEEYTISEGEEYTVDVACTPAQAVIHEFDSAWFDDKRIDAKSFDRNPPDFTPAELFYSQIGPNMLRLTAPQPGTFKLAIFYKPAPNADFLPDFLFYQYTQAIADGALAQLFMTPGHDWTSTPLGDRYRRKFETTLDANFNGNVRGQHRAPARTRIRYV